MADPSVERETTFYKAKLAKQAKRYDVMRKEMTTLAKKVKTLTEDEMDLIADAYKNAIGLRMDSWRILSDEESMSKGIIDKRIKGYKQEMEEEIIQICKDILWIIEKHLIPSSISTPPASVLQMKGDFYRYLAGDVKETSDKCLEAYTKTYSLAEKFNPLNATRLALAVNMSICHKVIGQNAERACKIVEDALRQANDEREKLENMLCQDLDEYKEFDNTYDIDGYNQFNLQDEFKKSFWLMGILYRNRDIWQSKIKAPK